MLPEEDPDRSAAIRRELAQRLKDIAQAKGADGKPLGSPSLFYALLLADGDRLGELLQVYKAGRGERGATSLQRPGAGHC